MSSEPIRRVGVYGRCITDSSILLTRLSSGDPDAGMWTLPGGGMDPGETHYETLVREFVEETALVPEIGRFLQSFSHIRPANDRRGPLHAIQFVYEVTAVGEPTVIEVGGSTAEAAWVPLRQANSLPLVGIAAWAVAGPGSLQSQG